MDDSSLGFSLALERHVSSLRACHESEGYPFVSAPNQHGFCDFPQNNWSEKSQQMVMDISGVVRKPKQKFQKGWPEHSSITRQMDLRASD